MNITIIRTRGNGGSTNGTLVPRYQSITIAWNGMFKVLLFKSLTSVLVTSKKRADDKRRKR